jgi:hypothetical protein
VDRAKRDLSDRLMRASAIGSALVAGCLILGAIAPSAAAAGPASGCNFPNPQYNHVIHVQFDNFHLRRDNPNVPLGSPADSCAEGVPRQSGVAALD